MTAIWRLTALEARFFLREQQALFWTLFFPAFMLLFFGHVFSEIGYVEFLVPGLIGMNLMSVAFFSMGAVLVSYRERGVLRRLRVTPLRPFAFIVAQVLNRSVIALVQAGVLILLAYLIFGVVPRGAVWVLGLTLVVGLWAFMGMGFAIASITTTRSAAHGIGQICFLPMLFLGGAYFPIAGFPQGLRAIGAALPLAPFLQAFRAVYGHGDGLAVIWLPLLVVGAWGAGALLISVWLFRWE